jgi:hypothetical protein
VANDHYNLVADRGSIDRMRTNAKLFRAVVVIGASLTAAGCDDDRCAACVPNDAVAAADARTDASVDAPTDAMPVDVIVII